MSGISNAFDFRKSVAYDAEAKRLFHNRARSQLRRLATTLGLEPASYDLRSNQAGIAVSGEITLHGDHLYVQVSQLGDGLSQRRSVPDLQGPERLCRWPKQFRIARLAQQARRARALDP